MDTAFASLIATSFSDPLLRAGFQRLFSVSSPDRLLPYYQGLTGSTEASLAGLYAFAAHGMAESAEVQALLAAVLKLQSPDGSVGSTPAVPTEGLWATSQFAVAAHLYKKPEARDRAIRFLLEFRSVPLEKAAELAQNNSLLGWSWTKSTFGWVEPTAWAVIALTMSGAADHPHAKEGRALIIDRQISGGGWNCGNRQVYNNDLLPFLDTTGLALLALVGQVPVDQYQPSLDWIATLDPSRETLYGLALAVLALRACERPVDTWRKALADRLSIDLQQSTETGYLNIGNLALALAAFGPAQVLNPMAVKK